MECERKGFMSSIEEESLWGAYVSFFFFFLSFLFNDWCWCLLSHIMKWAQCIRVDGNKAEEPGSLMIEGAVVTTLNFCFCFFFKWYKWPLLFEWEVKERRGYDSSSSWDSNRLHHCPSKGSLTVLRQT